MSYILFAIAAIAVSPFMVAFIKRFSEEKKIFTKDFMKDVKFNFKVTFIFTLAVITLLSRFGISLDFFVYSFLVCILLIMFYVDIRAQIIPNELNYILLVVGLLRAYYIMTVDVMAGLDLLLGMATGLLIFLGIAGFSLLVFKREGMGGGDIKLMGVLGLIFGFANIVQIFILCFLVGAVISIFLIATKMRKSDDYIPFGPYIVIAAYITIFVPASVLAPHILNLMLAI